MKVVYTIRVRPGVAVPVPLGTACLTIGTTAVNWKVTEGGHLEAVILELTGAEIRYNDNGAIMPTYPELEEEVYRVTNFVANQLLIQTGYDAIDPDQVLSEAPAISPENAKEENEFKTKHKLISKMLKYGWRIQGLFEPANYSHGFNHSAAHGYFADALRVASDFQQFELLYKVVEYFFPEDSTALDAAVSAHITSNDARYTPAVVEQLRLLRNRSIHPRARRGHVNPQNIAHVKEVRAKLPQMRRLASLLLAHPTF